MPSLYFVPRIRSNSKSGPRAVGRKFLYFLHRKPRPCFIPSGFLSFSELLLVCLYSAQPWAIVNHTADALFLSCSAFLGEDRERGWDEGMKGNWGLLDAYLANIPLVFAKLISLNNYFKVGKASLSGFILYLCFLFLCIAKDTDCSVRGHFH